MFILLSVLPYHPAVLADMCSDILAAAGANPDPTYYRRDQSQTRPKKPAKAPEESRRQREPDRVEISNEARQAAENHAELFNKISEIFKDPSLLTKSDRQLVKYLKEKRTEMHQLWEGDHEDRQFARALQNDLSAVSELLRRLAPPNLRRLALQEGLISPN